MEKSTHQVASRPKADVIRAQPFVEPVSVSLNQDHPELPTAQKLASLSCAETPHVLRGFGRRESVLGMSLC
jgi:hypothetical protein